MELPKIVIQALAVLAIAALGLLAFAGVLTWEAVMPLIYVLLSYLGIVLGYNLGARTAYTKARAEAEPAWLTIVPLAVIAIGIPFLVWYFFSHGW